MTACNPNPLERRRCASSMVAGITLASVIGAVIVLAPRSAEATPAYGRRYDSKCGTCHAPLPPRLNNLGILFRKAGFRMPDADDADNLVFKTVKAHGIGDAASLSAEVMARRDDEPEEGNKTSFELGEVELPMGTAVGDHFSAQAMYVLWDDGMSELENAEIQINAGPARHQFVARAGLLQTYLWQKGNHGALTLSKPFVLDDAPPSSAEGLIPFGLGAGQIGVDVGYILSNLDEGKITSTMITAAILNGVDDEGERAIRNTRSGADIYLQFLQLFGSRNTVSAFYYKGRTALEGEEGMGEEEGEEEEEGEGEEGEEEGLGAGEQKFTRYGIRGNYLLFDRLDLVAGAALGRDTTDPSTEEVDSRGFFAEADVTLTDRWIGVYRYDSWDPDTDEDGDDVRGHTLSTTFQAHENVYVTGELQRRILPDDETNDSVILNVRLIY